MLREALAWGRRSPPSPCATQRWTPNQGMWTPNQGMCDRRGGCAAASARQGCSRVKASPGPSAAQAQGRSAGAVGSPTGKPRSVQGGPRLCVLVWPAPRAKGTLPTVLLVASLGPEFPAPWGTGAPPVDGSRWQPSPGRKGGDLNKGQPLCKEHNNSQVAQSRRLPCSIVVSPAGVRGLAPAHLSQLFQPLSCGSSQFGVF